MIARLFKDTGRRYWLGYTIASFFMLLVSGSTAATAWIMKDVVNQVFIEHHADWLVYLSMLILAISVIRGIGVFGSTVALSRVGNSIIARTQKRLYDHFLALGMDFYNRTHPSDLVTRMSYNAGAARQVLNTVITSFGRDLLSLIGLVDGHGRAEPADVGDRPRHRPGGDLRRPAAGQAGAHHRQGRDSPRSA